MAHIVYEDPLVTEYSDGTEEVRFTEEEYAAMAADPVRFGYAFPCGHRRPENTDGTCWECEAIGERDDWMAEFHQRRGH